MRELDLIKTLADMGSTALVAGLFMYFAYKLVCRFGVAYLKTQERMADALLSQSNSMSDLGVAVKKFMDKDNFEHREILLGLQVVGGELQTLVTQIRKLDTNRGSAGYERERPGVAETQ